MAVGKHWVQIYTWLIHSGVAKRYSVGTCGIICHMRSWLTATWYHLSKTNGINNVQANAALSIREREGGKREGAVGGGGTEFETETDRQEQTESETDNDRHKGKDRPSESDTQGKQRLRSRQTDRKRQTDRRRQTDRKRQTETMQCGRGVGG